MGVINYNKYDIYLKRKKYRQTDIFKKWYEKYKISKQREDVLNKYSKSDKFKITQKQYRKSDLGKLSRATIKLKERAMKNHVIELFTFNQFLAKVVEVNNICPNCQKKFDNDVWKDRITIDHVYPISRAYDDYKKTGIKRIYTINDIQPLCMECNSKKNNKIN